MPSSGKTYKLGRIVGTDTVLGITDEQRSVHMHVIGASGSGKSKMLEYLIRQDIVSRRGLCLIDPHGTLARDVLAWASSLPMPPKHLHFIQPSSDEWTTCYNPLIQHGSDDFFLINAMKIAVVKCWGSDNTQATPRLDEWLRTLFFAGVKLGLTLPELGMLLDPSAERNPQRMYIAEALPKNQTGAASALRELCHLAEKGKTTDFENLVGSTKRRLAAFVDNPRLSRIFGIPHLSINLVDLMDQGGTLLVDLSVQGRFHAEDARLFGTLLLTDFYVQMFNRKRVDRPFSLYIDEFQNYATKDLARMLDEARKFNLNLVLAHQRPGQLRNSDSAEERDLYSAVMTNARNKIVMGGIDPEELEPIVRLLSMGNLNPDKIKNEIHTRGVLDYVKEYWEARSSSVSRSRSSSSGYSTGHGSSTAVNSTSMHGFSHGPGGMLIDIGHFQLSERSGSGTSRTESTNSGEAWSSSSGDSESESFTEFPVLVPVMGEQLSSRCYYSLEEQLYQFLAMVYGQARRQAMIRLVDQKEAIAVETPFVSPVKQKERAIERQLALSRKSVNWYLPVKEADALVLERKKEFLKLGCPQETITIPRFKTDAMEAVPVGETIVEAMTVQAEASDATMEENKPLPMPDTSKLDDINYKYGNTVLQSRDVEMLADLYESRFITIRHAALLHFAGLKSGEASAKRRLSLLEKAGLLTKQAVNLEKYKTIYTFNKAAFDALVECGVLTRITGDEWDAKLRKRFTGISQNTIEHEIGMLEIKAALAPSIKAVAHCKLVELGIWPQAYEFQYQSGGKFPVLRPDGFLAVASFQPNKTDAKHSFFYLELDRGTENHEALVEKMVAYRYYLRQGGFRKWIGAADGQPEPSFRVLFVFDTAMARQRIFNACLAFTEAKIETLAMMTSLDALVKDPLGAIWLTPIAHHRWLEAGRTGQPKLEALF